MLEKRFTTVEEEQNHYQEMCFGERERLGMKDTPPFTDACQKCSRIDWLKEWEAIKLYDNTIYG